MKDQYIFFWRVNDEHGYMSQWYPSPFQANGLTFPTAEHYMMWRKAKLFGDDEIAEQVLNAKSPKEAKALGRVVRGYDEEVWLQHRQEVIETGNVYKFAAHPELEQKLLATDGFALVEASPEDKVYGIGLAEDDPRAWDESTWEGENLLGKALTEVRRKLKMYLQRQ